MLERDRLGPVEGAAVEVRHGDRPGPGVAVYAFGRVVQARLELVRIDQFNLDRIAGELRLCAGELEAAGTAHRAASASQPTSQRPRKVSPPTRTVTSLSD